MGDKPRYWAFQPSPGSLRSRGEIEQLANQVDREAGLARLTPFSPKERKKKEQENVDSTNASSEAEKKPLKKRRK